MHAGPQQAPLELAARGPGELEPLLRQVNADDPLGALLALSQLVHGAYNEQTWDPIALGALALAALVAPCAMADVGGVNNTAVAGASGNSQFGNIFAAKQAFGILGINSLFASRGIGSPARPAESDTATGTVYDL